MRILIACEFSGRVRDAFIAKGHEAMSCDLLPTETPGPHYQGDVCDILGDGWDMMIAFPPCTHLASSGARWFTEKRSDGRQRQGIDFFMALADAPIPKKCIENPVGIMSTVYRKPDQIVQPWQFGHPESKATCLWLIGLPLLEPTNFCDATYLCPCGYRFPAELGKYGCANCCGDSGPARQIWDNQTPSGQNKLGPSPDRAKIRGRTYQGIATAMSDQWGNL